MTRQNAVQTQQQQASSASPLSRGGILQRQCEGCGQHTIAGGECTGCAKKKGSLQRKLTIGASNDPLELEAERVADQVMAAPTHSAVSAAPPHIQRFTGQPTGEADMEAPASVDRVLASPGRPLEPSLQQDMGQRFGHDFSRVRIHTGSAAERSAQEVNANAYTVRHNVAFGASQFAPNTNEGRRLIAHELTHVIQQSGSDRTLTGQKHEKHGLPSISNASAPQRIFRQIRAACYPTKRWPGNIEHSLIEDDYVTNVNPGGGALEYAIPQSGPNGGTGFADMVDLVGHKVYEIKTFVGAPGGVIEAARYAEKAQEHCAPPIPQMPWSVGNDYPAHTIPMNTNDELVVQQYPEFSGVVVYYKRRRRRVTEPLPVPLPVPVTAPDQQSAEDRNRRTNPQQQPVLIPQPAMQQIREFLRQVVESAQNAEEAARQFLQQHPELVNVIKAAAITIFLATIAEDILTLGAGIADDPATIAAAAALWRVATQLRVAQ
jgi:hypothetical protein